MVVEPYLDENVIRLCSILVVCAFLHQAFSIGTISSLSEDIRYLEQI